MYSCAEVRFPTALSGYLRPFARPTSLSLGFLGPSRVVLVLTLALVVRGARDYSILHTPITRRMRAKIVVGKQEIGSGTSTEDGG